MNSPRGRGMPVAKRKTDKDQPVDLYVGCRILVPDGLDQRIARASLSVHGIIFAINIDDDAAVTLAAKLALSLFAGGVRLN